MVRGGDRDSVDIFFFFFQHVAPVLIKLGIRMLLTRTAGLVFIHIADGDDFLAAAMLDITAALTPRADGGNAELVTRAEFARGGARVGAERCGTGGQSGVIDELTPC